MPTWATTSLPLTSLVDVTEERGGGLKFTRNGQTLTLQALRRKDLDDVEALMQVRHFLQRSGVPSQDPVLEGMHLLVVLDHREARVFRAELHGSALQHITPYDPHGARR